MIKVDELMSTMGGELPTFFQGAPLPNRAGD